MKTPREILLARHKTATPKLDTIRQSVVAAVSDRRPLSSWTSVSTFFQNIWRELIFPCRFIWTGLATVWLLILAANLSVQDHAQPALAKSSPSREAIGAFRQQQQLLTELIGPNDPPVAEPAKPLQPLPTSFRPFEVVTV